MKDVDSIFERGDVDHPVSAGGFSHPDFPNAGTNGFHRLPVVWINATLKPVKLDANLTAGIFGKSADI